MFSSVITQKERITCITRIIIRAFDESARDIDSSQTEETKKRVLWEKIYTQSSAVRNMQKEKIIIKALVLVSFLTYPS